MRLDLFRCPLESVQCKISAVAVKPYQIPVSETPAARSKVCTDVGMCWKEEPGLTIAWKCTGSLTIEGDGKGREERAAIKN